MLTRLFIDPEKIKFLAWECPKCHSVVTVPKPERGKHMVSAGCPICAGTKPTEIVREAQPRISFENCFAELDKWAEDGMFLVLTQEAGKLVEE